MTPKRDLLRLVAHALPRRAGEGIMSTVGVHRRVRPLRFAFLINHRNSEELRKAIQINTVLWGGMFNPIVEVFKRTPRSWGTTRRANDIIRGYLDAFEPDFVVTGRNIDATTFG